MARSSISITASRCMPGEVTREKTSNGSTPHVIANTTDKASLPVNRLERHAGKLARAVLRGGGDGDTASLPDRPLRSRFRQQLRPGVGQRRSEASANQALVRSSRTFLCQYGLPPNEGADCTPDSDGVTVSWILHTFPPLQRLPGR